MHQKNSNSNSVSINDIPSVKWYDVAMTSIIVLALLILFSNASTSVRMSAQRSYSLRIMADNLLFLLLVTLVLVGFRGPIIIRFFFYSSHYYYMIYW